MHLGKLLSTDVSLSDVGLAGSPVRVVFRPVCRKFHVVASPDAVNPVELPDWSPEVRWGPRLAECYTAYENALEDAERLAAWLRQQRSASEEAQLRAKALDRIIGIADIWKAYYGRQMRGEDVQAPPRDDALADYDLDLEFWTRPSGVRDVEELRLRVEQLDRYYAALLAWRRSQDD